MSHVAEISGVLSRPRVRGYTIDASHPEAWRTIREQATWVRRRGCCGYELLVCVPDVTAKMFLGLEAKELPSYQVPSWRGLRDFSLDPGRAAEVVAARISISSRGRLVGAIPFEAVVTSEADLTPEMIILGRQEQRQDQVSLNVLHSGELSFRLIRWQGGKSASAQIHPNRIVNELMTAANETLSRYVADHGGRVFFRRGGSYRMGNFTSPLQRKESIYFQIVLKMLMRGYSMEQVLAFFRANDIAVPFPDNCLRRISGSFLRSQEPRRGGQRGVGQPPLQQDASGEASILLQRLQEFVQTHREYSALSFKIVPSTVAPARGRFIAVVRVWRGNKPIIYTADGRDRNRALEKAATAMWDALVAKETARQLARQRR
jgi:hypothetical protein